ncbi:hypothetical protein [Paenibacillus camelliae]|uniref:hypothetical protein n=1 Tax=Paenibacillus camelliae TaxID=512410 RepID=UPI00203AD0F3|nr:hypothetical protein [Paenibacillus camelliae]MCM3635951.1 hypothetical protein [Paenibacillus camelliae]
MDDSKDLLLSSYSQLVILLQKQIDIAAKDSYDEQLDEIKSLEEGKSKCISSINQIRLNVELYNGIIEEHSETVFRYIEQLSELNETLIQRINLLYAEASKSMKRVTTQRRTLQSYGGVNFSDVISYYFDEKK